MVSNQCKHECCTRQFVPLKLAYGKTAHTFQGQNAGPTPPGKPPNAVQTLVVDHGSRNFKGINVGCSTSLQQEQQQWEYVEENN